LRFVNLIDLPWVPVAGGEAVSLYSLFCGDEHITLGGNPVEKITVLKFLLAICQAAMTPESDEAWSRLGKDGLAEAVMAYLQIHHDAFNLYGTHPFLQFPALKGKETKRCPYTALDPSIASGNTTKLFQTQDGVSFSDAQRALLLIQLQGFALGGKIVDNSIILSPGYKGKTKTGGPGPLLGFKGYLHAFFETESIRETCWLNTLTLEEISAVKWLTEGLGTPPWEKMPEGEDDSVARRLSHSYFGWLVPMNRFLLFNEDDCIMTEGIQYMTYKEGVTAFTCGMDTSGKEPKTLWVDSTRKPWRQLTSLLAFLDTHSQNLAAKMDVVQLRLGYKKLRLASISHFCVWAGGLSVTSNAGQQYPSGNNDYIASSVPFENETLDTNWYVRFVAEMKNLEDISKTLFSSCYGYYKNLKSDDIGKLVAPKACEKYWSECEKEFPGLIHACDADVSEERLKFRKCVVHITERCYTAYCPRASARQLEAWAKAKPKLGKYVDLIQEKGS
jgi:CRISPR system Cascade subunit CasA